MIFIGRIIITILVRKHIVVINFIKVSSIADGCSETFNNLMRSQYDAKEICCNILSAIFLHSQPRINGWNKLEFLIELEITMFCNTHK
jgi:hypothetical protein